MDGTDSFSFHFARSLEQAALPPVEKEVPTEAILVSNAFHLKLIEPATGRTTRSKGATTFWVNAQTQAYRDSLPDKAAASETTFRESF